VNKEVDQYRERVDDLVREVSAYVESADIQGYDGTFAKEEVDAMRTGAITALQAVSIILLGSRNKFLGIDPMYGLSEHPRDVAEHIIKSALPLPTRSASWTKSSHGTQPHHTT
jgi:hypothetical protein